jgi:hypothetical protein
MTFTWTGDLSTDLDTVRFHLGDTDENAAWLQDETITALLAREGSVNGAVIAGIRYILTQLSRPDFKADWLSVSNHKAAYEMWRRLLDEKLAEFNVGGIAGEAVHTYRADTLLDEAPVYPESEA